MNEHVTTVLRSIGYVEVSPNVWERPNRADVAAVRSDESKRPQGKPLVSVLPREEASGHCFKIVFDVYAVRAGDWDNYSIKELQDMVVNAGILFDDDWTILESGTIRVHKVKKKNEQKTVITIEEID